MQRANADLISPGPVLSSCARVGTKKEKTATSPSKMTGGEYKVWQPLERAAGTKKKKEGKFIFFFFQKTF